jgi:folylpolyglutamate synthase/dihydropteroate synthase
MHELCLSRDEIIKCLPSDIDCNYEYISLSEACDMILSNMHQNVIITGSLYLAGDIIKYFYDIDMNVTEI